MSTELAQLRTEVAASRVEVAELKDLLVQTIDALGRRRTLSDDPSRNILPQYIHAHASEHERPMHEINEALCRGDRSLYNAQQKPRREAWLKAQKAKKRNTIL